VGPRFVLDAVVKRKILSPRRNRTLDSCEYIEKGVADSRKGGGSPAWRLGVGLTTPHHKNLTCYEMFQSASELD
jgi:hypothetical protein